MTTKVDKLDVIIDHNGCDITDSEVLLETLNLLVCHEGWKLYCNKMHVDVGQFEGIENLTLVCNHAKDHKSKATKRFQCSITNDCKWRLLLVHVINEQKAGLRIGYYVKAYSPDTHAESHNETFNCFPKSFDESTLLNSPTSPKVMYTVPEFSLLEVL